jgi:hypothetical protein
MAFAIQWTGPMDHRRPNADTPIEALSGIDTLAKGHADVVIVHLSKDGKAYAPTDFAKFYSDKENSGP